MCDRNGWLTVRCSKDESLQNVSSRRRLGTCKINSVYTGCTEAGEKGCCKRPVSHACSMGTNQLTRERPYLCLLRLFSLALFHPSVRHPWSCVYIPIYCAKPSQILQDYPFAPYSPFVSYNLDALLSNTTLSGTHIHVAIQGVGKVYSVHLYFCHWFGINLWIFWRISSKVYTLSLTRRMLSESLRLYQSPPIFSVRLWFSLMTSPDLFVSRDAAPLTI